MPATRKEGNEEGESLVNANRPASDDKVQHEMTDLKTNA